MKITGSSLQLESSHYEFQRHEISESLRMWVGNRRPDFEGDDSRRPTPTEIIQISDAGRAAQAGETSAVEQGLDAAEHDPVLSLIRRLLAMLTGEEVKVFDAAELQPDTGPAVQAPTTANSAPSQPAGFGVEYDYRESYTEVEQTAFDAQGVVQTADGREINFNLSLFMARSYHVETSVSLRLGDARQKSDPLVINFSGNAAQLTDQRFAFDLNSDGTASEQINYLAGGAGFLAFDRNGNRRIDNGTELFGARSGDGFAELAELDSDCNGWIDENDEIFSRLRIWTLDEAGNKTLLALGQAGIGAIYLGNVRSEFGLKTETNEQLGQIRSSGIFLKETGEAGTIQHVDLAI